MTSVQHGPITLSRLPPIAAGTLQLGEETLHIEPGAFQREEVSVAIANYLARCRRRPGDVTVFISGPDRVIRVELCSQERLRELLVEHESESRWRAAALGFNAYEMVGQPGRVEIHPVEPLPVPRLMPAREEELRAELGLSRRSGKRAQRWAVKPWAVRRSPPRGAK